MFGHGKIRNLSASELNGMLHRSEVVLIDVREPPEFAAERIHGALNFPLSTFDPAALPRHADRAMVMQCGSGKRSAMAVERCQASGLEVDSHLAGGIMAWRAAGLPTVAFDPTTGALRDPEAR